MKFTKMQGCGNDYVYIDAITNKIENASELAIKLSNRNYGIGSDGLILICSSEIADFRMDMYNADGSGSQMCGNGIRCLGKFVYDHGMTTKKELDIETPAGIKHLQLHDENGKITSVTVDMGVPELEARKIPVNSDESPVLRRPITVGGCKFDVSCVSMGNPHAAVYVDDVSQLPMETIGPRFENHDFFPERVNTEFVEITDRKNIKMRVWERGSGETMACGTGACACAYVSMLNGFTDDEVSVSMRGGTLKIRFCREDGHIYMTGPAVTVFEGEL